MSAYWPLEISISIYHNSTDSYLFLVISKASDRLDSVESTHRTHTMKGVIFYYPHTIEGETRPSMEPYGKDDTDTESVSTSGAGGASARIGGLDAGTAKLDRTFREPVFSVIWGGRLVPETHVNSLPFFPKLMNRAKCEALQLPENWTGRIKGFLFLGSDFEHIQNNKLQIRVSPNLEAYLHAREKLLLFQKPTVRNDLLR